VELSLRGLSFTRHQRPVLDRVSATIPATGLTCILGINGAGKTTMLRILCGELRPVSGTFLIGALDAGAMAAPDIARHFAIIPQKSPAPPYLTVSEMVALGRFRPRRSLWWRLDEEDRRMMALSMARCQIEEFADRKVAELSGGEQQRVWLAFGLASHKPFLILDETLDGMDVFAKRAFFRLLRELSREERAVILATHDLTMVTECADRVIALSRGKIVYEGAATGDVEGLLGADGA
jgi:ABC-type cobalamin/Fe3+-siderophores transport system ATPase subunit